MNIDGDLVLKVWAVIGPLLAGAASAFWSRKNQISDRDYERSIRIDEQRNQIDRENLEKSQKAKEDRYREMENLLSGFLAAAYQYVSNQTHFLNNMSTDSRQAASIAFDKYSSSLSTLSIVGDDKVATAAINVWNTSFQMPCPVKTMNDDMKAYSAKADAYKIARAEFAIAAKQCLAEIR